MAAIKPIVYFFVSMFFSLVALQSSQPCRAALFVLLVTFALLAFHGINEVTNSPEQADVLGLFILIYISHMGCVLLVEKHTLTVGKARASWRRWKSAYRMMFNARWIGTERLAPDICVRSSSGANRERPKYHDEHGNIPVVHKKGEAALLSRRVMFLIQRLVSSSSIFGLNCLWRFLLAPHPLHYHPLEYSDFRPTKQTYIRRLYHVTARESIIRLMVVFNFVWSAWALFTGLHDVLAILFVGIGLDEPDDWPQLYGRVDQAYTLRRFWGKFWHRLVYRSYTGYGIVLSETVIRLPRSSFLGKLLVNFVVFFLSGVVHALVTWKLGFTCGYWEDIEWFCLNFLGVLVEECMQWVINKGFRLGKQSTRWKRIGYVWVFGFFFWSLPKTQYPKVFCEPK
jgi:hypothetical protein